MMFHTPISLGGTGKLSGLPVVFARAKKVELA